MLDFIEKRVMYETSKDRLTEVRKYLGKTQKDFGEVLGISDKTYSTYENESRPTNIPWHHLKKLVQEFHINPDYIMKGSYPMFLKEGDENYINKASEFYDNAYVGSQSNYKGNVEYSSSEELLRKYYQLEGIAQDRKKTIDEQQKKIDKLKFELEECLKRIRDK